MSEQYVWQNGEFAFLLERDPFGTYWMEVNGGSREHADPALAAEVIRIAAEKRGAVIATERIYRGLLSALRKDLLAALGEEMEIHESQLINEASWRRGHNACRASVLDAINRLLSEEGS